MGKAKGTSEVEARDTKMHLRCTEESLTRKKKKTFKLKILIMPNKIVAKAKDFWSQNT